MLQCHITIIFQIALTFYHELLVSSIRIIYIATIYYNIYVRDYVCCNLMFDIAATVFIITKPTHKLSSLAFRLAAKFVCRFCGRLLSCMTAR